MLGSLCHLSRTRFARSPGSALSPWPDPLCRASRFRLKLLTGAAVPQSIRISGKEDASTVQLATDAVIHI